MSEQHERVVLFNNSQDYRAAGMEVVVNADLVGFKFSQPHPPGHEPFPLVHVVKYRHGPTPVTWTVDEWERAAEKIEKASA